MDDDLLIRKIIKKIRGRELDLEDFALLDDDLIIRRIISKIRGKDDMADDLLGGNESDDLLILGELIRKIAGQVKDQVQMRKDDQMVDDMIANPFYGKEHLIGNPQNLPINDWWKQLKGKDEMIDMTNDLQTCTDTPQMQHQNTYLNYLVEEGYELRWGEGRT